MDLKYISLVSAGLRNFKQKSSQTWNCSCPLCGDSARRQRKARGYIFLGQNGYRYHCHNCSASLSFKNFLKKIAPELYRDYLYDLVAENKQETESTPAPEFKISKFDLDGAIRVPDLPEDHPARIYLGQRKIPPQRQSDIWLVENFAAWVNERIPGKFSEQVLSRDQPRIILPFRTALGAIYGLTGRSLDASSRRYITVIFDRSQPRLFGLDRINLEDKIYLTEGPFDSMFLPNALALTGGDLYTAKDKDWILVFDNEPRNFHTCNKILKAIELGFRVVIWPSDLKQKDINEMVLAGIEVLPIIEANTLCGLEAELALVNFRKDS